MAFIDWLREQHRTSQANRATFGARPEGAASRVWKGYQDPQDGQSLMVRQREPFPRAPSPLSTGGVPAPNPLVAGGAPMGVRAAPAPQVAGGNVPFAPQFDPRSGFGVGGMGGNLPPEGMWDMIIAAIMGQWGDVKKGKKKIQSRIDRNRVRRERRFEYEG